MGISIAAAASALAVILPLLDSAIKDGNNQKVKYYQQQIDTLATKYNLRSSDLNKMLSRYQNQYGYAVESLYNSVRGSTQNKKAIQLKEEAKRGIESTQSDIAQTNKQYEAANQAMRDVQRKYENKGVIETISGLLGNNK